MYVWKQVVFIEDEGAVSVGLNGDLEVQFDEI